jgi:predicted enzyme related to lactoylglutathione lyase
MPKKVTGIGGIFFRSNDPAKTREWYAAHLGLSDNQWGSVFDWREADSDKKGATIWSAFSANSKRFEPSTKDFMINFRVENLEWLLSELKKEGIEQVGEMEADDYGKFAHIMDPEGNKIELWEDTSK